MTNREKFIELFEKNITRDGSKELLKFLCDPNQSDFFTAPASTKYHSAYEGGLLDHSLNVYECLKDYLERNKVKDEWGLAYSDETIALVSLMHDLCKVNVYKVSSRNVKDPVTGQWKPVPYYEYDDKLPYGHGEKSVYMLSGFMRLSREEAFAIRFHMGFSNEDDPRNVGGAFEMFPLALALSIADTEATYFIEAKKNN